MMQDRKTKTFTGEYPYVVHGVLHIKDRTCAIVAVIAAEEWVSATVRDAPKLEAVKS